MRGHDRVTTSLVRKREGRAGEGSAIAASAHEETNCFARRANGHDARRLDRPRRLSEEKKKWIETSVHGASTQVASTLGLWRRGGEKMAMPLWARTDWMEREGGGQQLLQSMG